MLRLRTRISIIPPENRSWPTMLLGERENSVSFDAKKSNDFDVKSNHVGQQGRKCWILDKCGESSS
jgi:hypothetical protein